MSVQDSWEYKKEKRKAAMQSMYNYLMGVIWIATGLFFLLNKKLGVEWMKSDSLIDSIFGCVGIGYGLFRLYRGYHVKRTYK